MHVPNCLNRKLAEIIKQRNENLLNGAPSIGLSNGMWQIVAAWNTVAQIYLNMLTEPRVISRENKCVLPTKFFLTTVKRLNTEFGKILKEIVYLKNLLYLPDEVRCNQKTFWSILVAHHTIFHRVHCSAESNVYYRKVFFRMAKPWLNPLPIQLHTFTVNIINSNSV